MNNNTLLLTGTIDPNVFNKNGNLNKINVYLTDENTRRQQYCSSIEKYIKDSVFCNIVFIENSGSHFNAEQFYQLATAHDKNFEYISHVLEDEQIFEMQLRGKSYGEAELIDFAIRNSELINEVDFVYKVTGRVFLKNSKRILKSKNRKSNEFIVKNSIGWANTEFFKISKVDYFMHLERGLNLMDDYNNKNIERVWYQLMKKSEICVDSFSVFPRLQGIIGSTNNKTYDKTILKYFICDLLCKMKFFRLK